MLLANTKITELVASGTTRQIALINKSETSYLPVSPPSVENKRFPVLRHMLSWACGDPDCPKLEGTQSALSSVPQLRALLLRKERLGNQGLTTELFSCDLPVYFINVGILHLLLRDK